MSTAADEFVPLIELQGEARYCGPLVGLVIIGDKDEHPAKAGEFTAMASLVVAFGDDNRARHCRGLR